MFIQDFQTQYHTANRSCCTALYCTITFNWLCQAIQPAPGHYDLFSSLKRGETFVCPLRLVPLIIFDIKKLDQIEIPKSILSSLSWWSL